MPPMGSQLIQPGQWIRRKLRPAAEKPAFG